MRRSAVAEWKHGHRELGIGANRTKLIEVTREKKVVWTYTDETPHGIHHFQILDTNGKPLEGMPRR